MGIRRDVVTRVLPLLSCKEAEASRKSGNITREAAGDHLKREVWNLRLFANCPFQVVLAPVLVVDGAPRGRPAAPLGYYLHLTLG